MNTIENALEKVNTGNIEQLSLEEARALVRAGHMHEVMEEIYDTTHMFEADFRMFFGDGTQVSSFYLCKAKNA